MKQLLIFLSCCLLITSCSIFTVPQRNESIIVQTLQLQKTMDSVYDAMISGNKDYNTNAAGYDAVSNQITQLSNAEATRNKIIASEVATLQTRFNFYRQQHQSKTVLNNAELVTYKNDLDGYFSPIYHSENAFK